MNKYTDQKQLLDFIKKHDPSSFEFTSELKPLYATTDYDFYKQSNTIKRRLFENCEFEGINFSNLGFEDCRFRKCTFKNTNGFFLNFYNCEFEHTSFINFELIHTFSINLLFKNCSFRSFDLEESDLINAQFVDCGDIKKINFGCDVENVTFLNCNLMDGMIGGPSNFDNNEEVIDYHFDKCKFEFFTFINSYLNNSHFISCNYYQVNFNNCELSNKTFNSNKLQSDKGFCNIDLQTIIQSETLNYKILSNIFGITTADIQKTIRENIIRSEYHSVFISYSIKDEWFALSLNNILHKNGIKTFLWSKDAPGGKFLHSIMRTNIRKFDKVLFIASENSIKSKACQFELSEGRKKQEKLWKEIYFPIHIDNYIFELEKENIRPVEFQDEYWKNISEILLVNSLDFSHFNQSNIKTNNFEKAIIKIIETLKKQ